MDHFGIGTAMQGMALIYFQSARRTGRTTSLVESVKTGDRVVFIDRDHAKRFQQLCQEREVDVECIVVPPSEPRKLFQYPTSQGRTIFDHCWVQEFYLGAVIRTMEELDYLEREASGYGAAHRETRRMAQEMAKWRL